MATAACAGRTDYPRPVPGLEEGSREGELAVVRGLGRENVPVVAVAEVANAVGSALGDLVFRLKLR